MLYIDPNLLNHIKSNYPDRVVKEHMKGIWWYNRWIQISTPIKDSKIHYEYLFEQGIGSIQLHIEADIHSTNYSDLVNSLIYETEGISDFNWSDWITGNGYRCVLMTPITNINEFDNLLATFVEKFDSLILKVSKNNNTSISLPIDVCDNLQLTQDHVDLYPLKLEDVLRLPLAIPEYQRIYCWEEKNVLCLLNDMLSHIENSTSVDVPYRLGTIILHRNNGKYDVIDGQQRLVTLSLLINELGYRSNLLSESFKSKRSNDYVAYNKYLIQSFCRKHICTKKFAELILSKIEFSVLVLQNSSIDLAYTFFSNQNSRGVSLTDYDLLKAHHLRFIPSSFEKQATHAAETWNQMIENGRGYENTGADEPDYSCTLDTYLYRLRKWMRKKPCDLAEGNYRVKAEYEAAPIIEEIAPFGEKFYFNEPIQGGTHFFTYVEHHLAAYRQFIETPTYKNLHAKLTGGSTQWYRDVIEALLFGYYLKFKNQYIAEALSVIFRIVLQHRYQNSRALKQSIVQYAGDTEIIMMIDNATSPTFFLAEAREIAKELPYPSLQDMTPIQRRVMRYAKEIMMNQDFIVTSFKKINL